MVTAKLAFTIASTAIQAIGAIKQGNAANAAAQFNAQVAENNAVLSRQTAAANAAKQNRIDRKKLGLLRANIGASGVDVSGTPLDLLSDSASEAELNRRTILQQGEVRAIGFQNTANLERARGRAAKSAGFFGAATGILLGGASAFGGGGGFAPNAGASDLVIT